MQESESGFCVKAARIPLDCSTSTGLGVSPERSLLGAPFSRNHWSSSENNNNNAWNQRFSDGNQNNNNKNNENSVRAVRDFTQEHRTHTPLIINSETTSEVWVLFLGVIMQLELFEAEPTPATGTVVHSAEIPLEDIFDAYYACRKHKRSRSGAMQFEVDFEHNLVELWQEINSGTWTPRPSTVFVMDKPVQREIFAASFRDRIVHHLVIGRLNPLFEQYFIHDSYSCRVGKGTHFGIHRAARFIRRCSFNNTRKVWILKIDIRGYFMSINRNILYQKLAAFIDERYTAPDKALIQRLCYTIIFNDPTKNCVFHSPRSSWDNLPKDKSLFTAHKDCGLPIGNLTSQIFANFYLTEFDHFIKHRCGIRNYGRYVDDCVFVHTSRPALKRLVPVIRNYLAAELRLTLHPKKIYLQPCGNGVRFLGCCIKPSHIVVNLRIFDNFKTSIQKHNAVAYHHKPDKVERAAFIASVNSYLGILRHYKTFRRRRHVLQRFISPRWYKHITLCAGYRKISQRRHKDTVR
jgi:retron-type reverse transcriptase